MCKRMERFQYADLNVSLVQLFNSVAHWIWPALLPIFAGDGSFDGPTTGDDPIHFTPTDYRLFAKQ